MRKRLKVLLALILGFVSGAIHYQPATAAAEGNSSEHGGLPIERKPLTFAWIERPPYVASPDNGSLDTFPQGMMRDALGRYILVECGWQGLPKVDYQVATLKVESDFRMIELLRQNKAHVALPIFENPSNRRYPEFPFLKLHDYPGTEYITTDDKTSALSVVLDSVLKAWPLLAVTFVLTAIAGVVIWALVGIWLYKSKGIDLPVILHEAIAVVISKQQKKKTTRAGVYTKFS